jgi:RNA polymerase sigma-70 factor (sigma-E family)
MALRNPEDVAAFTTFAAASSPALFRTAYLVLHDHQLAQDLLQEALVKTYVAWPRIRDHDRAEAYVRRVIVTTAISWRRRRSFHERPIDEGHEVPAATDVFEGLAEQQAVWEQLALLPPRQRAAIVLRYYEDLSEATTAELMGCSVGTVKSQVSTGLARLRRLAGSDVAAGVGRREMAP